MKLCAMILLIFKNNAIMASRYNTQTEYFDNQPLITKQVIGA